MEGMGSTQPFPEVASACVVGRSTPVRLAFEVWLQLS